MQLINKIWQQVPGAGQVRIFPFFRKPSVTSSNAYVLRFPKAVVVIDPGADPVQTMEIIRLIREQQQEKKVPVFIWLTHAHFDHFLSLKDLSGQSFRIKVACHDYGAEVLEKKGLQCFGSCSKGILDAGWW